MILSRLAILISLFFVFMHPCRGNTANIAKDVKTKAGASITTRQNTQKKLDKWEQEKFLMIAEYEQLKQEQGVLTEENNLLLKEASEHRKLVDSLVLEKEENLRIQEEMLPFLKNIQLRLESFIANDPPFLKEERRIRLEKLNFVMEDIEISIAEKYRKVMEALFVEAEYGNTIEVYQDKIDISGKNVMADIFRLGRISLFAMSLDQAYSAFFNVGENQWMPLEKKYNPSIKTVVEIGKKRRTVEVVSLPLGRLAD